MKLRLASPFGVVLASFHGGVLVDAFNAFAQFAPLLQKTSSSAAGPPPPPSRVETESWLDVLKYDETPKFDVLAKTIEYANCKDFDSIMTYYADDYVFRGPVVGPITAEDVRKTSEVSISWYAYADMLTISLFSVKALPQNWLANAPNASPMDDRAFKSNPPTLTCKRALLGLLSILTIHSDAISSSDGRAPILRA